jgi:glycine/D-amino acid oxidase-like deaminating enzyme
VVVLGAGLAGLTTTLALLRPGRRIAVLETASVAAGASGADLGHVATGLGMPYTRAVARHGAESARTIWEWHREGHERLRGQLEALHDECGYRQRGGFVLARDRSEGLELADSEDALRDEGFPGEFLDHYMLEARFDVRGFTGAYWAADDGEVEPVALLGALAGAAVARGAELFEASGVEEVEVDARGVRARTAGGEVSAVTAVVALGAQTPALFPALAPLLVAVPARRLVCPYSSGLVLPSPVRTVGGGLGWRLGQDFRIAAFGEPAALTFESLAGVLETHLTAPSPPQGRWAGTLCTSPDGLPVVGPLPGTPLVAVLGLGALGHSWAMMAAHWAADSLDRGTDAAPALLRASRHLGASSPG